MAILIKELIIKLDMPIPAQPATTVTPPLGYAPSLFNEANPDSVLLYCSDLRDDMQSEMCSSDGIAE